MQRKGVQIRIDDIQTRIRIDLRVLPHAGEGQIDGRHACEVLRDAVTDTATPHTHASYFLVAGVVKNDARDRFRALPVADAELRRREVPFTHVEAGREREL